MRSTQVATTSTSFRLRSTDLPLGSPMMRRTPPPAARRYGRPSEAQRSPAGRRAPRIAMLPAIILGGFAGLAAALFIGLLGVFAAYTAGLPDPSQLEQFKLSQGSTVVSADGVKLATFAAEDRKTIPFAQIPKLMIDAQVAAEDRTFWTNPCIDFRGIVRAALQNF